jgi:oxygen-independent coproporphyrinogen-3 oxidase
LQWEDSLNRVIDTGVPHISAYSLIVEPGTPFHQLDEDGKLKRPDEDEEAGMYETAISTLVAAGYEQYEISAFAKPGFRCRHNQVYWRNQEYVGFGNGATSYVNGERFTREPGLESYVRLAETGRETTVEQERLDRRGSMGETMMMGLRFVDGINRNAFRQRFGEDPVDVYEADVAKFAAAGLVQVTDEAVALTHRGLFLANEVWEAFV